MWLKKLKPAAVVFVAPSLPGKAHGHPVSVAAVSSIPGEWAPDEIVRPTLREWKQLNERARAKLPDHILPNWHGTVMDTNTDLPMEVEDFQGWYGLSEQEAKTLFMTL